MPAISRSTFVLCALAAAAAAAANSLQSRPTLCNPIDGSPPGSPIPGILQARTLEWVEPIHRVSSATLFFNFYFYYILLYNTVLVLPYIDMNQPWVYMSSQS